MFRAGETRQKKLNLLKQLPSEIHTSSVPSPSSEGRELSYGLEFINNLSKSTATSLKRFMYTKNNCDFKIISKNLDDDINIDELAKLVSVTTEDGEFFKDWLSCYVTDASAETITPAYNDTILNHDLKLEFLQPKLNIFCTSNHIRLISIRSHHVVLRCKLKKKLSKFTTKDGGNTTSHLCDVKNCLRPEHLIIENMAMNGSRLACPGVILILQNQEPNTPKKIMQIKPCQHGINRRNASGNFLKFSCRKIQVMIEDADTIEYIKKLV
ncbi:unnamed protein product [Adineta steineri]|uniref:Zinc-binding loop region of homing endonuclease domain-containing protein n=1 Tax=Adineta steineri TaxID=433720 RepID=A0A815U311_9BILA|nr:unnamed protein product [Adineta steineri]CAF1515245.1 unnamed protein product [Adineta steineri]